MGEVARDSGSEGGWISAPSVSKLTAPPSLTGRGSLFHVDDGFPDHGIFSDRVSYSAWVSDSVLALRTRISSPEVSRI